MRNLPPDMDAIKRRLRKLKKLEIKIRMGNMGPTDACFNSAVKARKINLVWDEFFDLSETYPPKAKYPIAILAVMNKDNLKEIIDEYFYYVYYRFYRENGMINIPLYDPDILSQMGLPPDAGHDDIKRKFRQLAKKYHPDTGGDSAKFIELMEIYNKLMK